MSNVGLDEIMQIAADSPIVHYQWKNRGLAPIGYIKGMAVMYARAYCSLKNGEAATLEMAKADTGDATKDALAWYEETFRQAGMANDIGGADTLRHLFVLLTGLGMRESSGRYCEGRDRSAHNTSAETAEAGLFQTSYNAKSAHPLMPQLFAQHAATPSGLATIFAEGVHCKPIDWENFGAGDGEKFQRLTKESPPFAVEFAAVGLRNVRQHWGPINRRAAEIRPECDDLLVEVQSAVDAADHCHFFQ